MKKQTPASIRKEVIKKLEIECLDIGKLCVFKKYGRKDIITGRDANVAHHIIPRAESKFLKFEVDNGVPLENRKTHFRIHYTPNHKDIDIKIEEGCGKERWQGLKNNYANQISYNSIETMLKVRDRLSKQLYGDGYIADNEDFIKALKK